MRWTPIIGGTAALATVAAAHAATYYTVAQAQAAMFPGAQFTPAPVALTPDDRIALLAASGVREPFDGSGVWRVSTGGWFVTDAVVGKHEKIRYAVGIDRAGRIVGVEILQYNETYGYQVRDATWRRQFIGKTAGDPVRLGDRTVGHLTSVVRHHEDGPIALALVKRNTDTEALLLAGTGDSAVTAAQTVIVAR